MLQHFIIEGKHVGKTERQVTFVGHYAGHPQSLGFYCGSCGDTFARSPVVAPNGEVQEWLYYRLCCRKCRPPYQSLVPGSIFLSWDRDFTAAFPDAVLRWEFERHLEWFQRIYENAN